MRMSGLCKVEISASNPNSRDLRSRSFLGSVNQFFEIYFGCWPQEVRFGKPHQSPSRRLDFVCVRTCLGLCRPTPASNRQQEKQRGTMQETRVGNSGASRNTHERWNHVESSGQPKDQREDSADHGRIAYLCREALQHFSSAILGGISIHGTLKLQGSR